MSLKPEASNFQEPTYRDVCSGMTPYVEVLHLLFNAKIAPYEEILKFFFTFHDSTTLNYQGNDRGPQYASVIFYQDQ